ncbi:MAG: hypothetical protein CBC35_01560 [Planctomycetes bacterium TMED75]|nr:hypothetical protein [Planctomycetaceae bacterium]OUU96246.1 MAG: hypothetical protein CBC35_01560 [Planctomycetes bacterium TMED75]
MQNDNTELASLLSLALEGGDESNLSRSQRAALNRLKQVIETIRSDTADPVPARVLERARSLESRLPRPVSWLDRTVAFVMNPLLDSLHRPEPGLRGHELRQCTFETEGYRLDLEIAQPATEHPSGDQTETETELEVEVRGQLDSEQPIEFPLRVALIRKGSDASVLNLETTQDGGFVFQAPAGSYELAFELSTGNQMIGSIELP